MSKATFSYLALGLVLIVYRRGALPVASGPGLVLWLLTLPWQSAAILIARFRMSRCCLCKKGFAEEEESIHQRYKLTGASGLTPAVQKRYEYIEYCSCCSACGTTVCGKHKLDCCPNCRSKNSWSERFRPWQQVSRKDNSILFILSAAALYITIVLAYQTYQTLFIFRTVQPPTTIQEAHREPPRDSVEKSAAKAKIRLGVSISELTKEQQQQLGFRETGGVLVTEIASQSFAEDVGLVPYDVITAINKVPVGSAEDLNGIRAHLKPGDAVEFRVLRRTAGPKAGWQKLVLAGTLGERL